MVSYHGRKLDCSSQAAHAPEENSEENKPAAVDADGVPEFVSSASVVLRVNSYVIANGQIRKSQRHKGALHNSQPKPRAFAGAVQQTPCLVQTPPDASCQKEEPEEAKKKAGSSICGGGRNLGCGGHCTHIDALKGERVKMLQD